MSQPTRVSLRDIARVLGISHATVSLALRDHPRISLGLRKKIQQTATEMQYRPDPMLAALASYKKSKGKVHAAGVLAWVNCWPEPARLRCFPE
ncbi:MAG TPA: helix-turn-helix domain-containing protein, partial [Chthoniobacteraceae bacterium]